MGGNQSNFMGDYFLKCLKSIKFLLSVVTHTSVIFKGQLLTTWENSNMFSKGSIKKLSEETFAIN